jgi:hypothetical protein
MTEGDGMFNLDSDSDDEDELEHSGAPFAYQSPGILAQSSSTTRRIKVGPPQDSDVKGKKYPPQLMLQKIEKIVHKISMKLSVEMVSAPAGDSNMLFDPMKSLDSCSAMSSEGDVTTQLQLDALKKKKAVYDAFDRLLGLETRTANPVARISSIFLGPLMRVIRAAIFVVRVAFHIATWRDPYLSFWAGVCQLLLLLILIIFPWRGFFFLVVMGCFGPQVSKRRSVLLVFQNDPILLISALKRIYFFEST